MKARSCLLLLFLGLVLAASSPAYADDAGAPTSEISAQASVATCLAEGGLVFRQPEGKSFLSENAFECLVYILILLGGAILMVWMQSWRNSD